MSMDDPQHAARADGAPWRNFYGRRHGKTLRPRQKRLLEEALPRLSVPGVGWDDNPDRAPIDLTALFGARPVWLEIGFGGGEHLLAMARANPGVGFIGCEAFENGVAMALANFDDDPVENIRIHYGDARFLLDVLPAASLERVYLLYPDPWPKRAHIPRRFFNPGNLDALARAMAAGAELRLATDIPAYVQHAVRVAAAHPGFETQGGPERWRAAFDGWPGTRYERKALKAGRVPAYLRFLRTG